MKELKDRIRELEQENLRLTRMVNKCPACNGHGHVLTYASAYDSFDLERETCSKCHGSGVRQ